MTMHLSCTVAEIQSLKDFWVTTLTFWSHVTSSVRWPMDSLWSLSYWCHGWPCVYLALLWRYKASKLHLAHIEGQKFTAHAWRHVTCRQRVKNDYLFGISNKILPIHYTTSIELWWRLTAVYRWKFYAGTFWAKNFQVRFWAQFLT